MFYLVCRSKDERIQLIEHLKQNNINAVFHYICLHDSPYYHDKHDGREMPNAKRYEECLVRLPLWVGLSKEQIDSIVNVVLNFYV
jgi:dTDP-4-amino-4,6-dideoxygalactose transaminase